MVKKLEDFVNLVEDWQRISRAPKEIYATDDLEGSEKARNRLNRRATDLNGVAPNYDDRSGTLTIAKDVINRDEATVMGYFAEHEKAILGDADVRDWATENFLKVTPTKNGKSEHDRIVDLHRARNGYHELVEKIDKDEIKYSSITGQLLAEVERDLGERRANDPNSKYITGDEAVRADQFRKMVARAIVGNKSTGMAALGAFADESTRKLYEAIGDENSRADYAIRNIRESFYEGDDAEVEGWEDAIKAEGDADKRADLESDFSDLRRSNKLTAATMLYQASGAAEKSKAQANTPLAIAA